MKNDGGHIATWEGIPPTGKHWTIDGMFFLRFANGKIIEQRGMFDWLPVVKQLGGTITPPTT